MCCSMLQCVAHTAAAQTISEAPAVVIGGSNMMSVHSIISLSLSSLCCSVEEYSIVLPMCCSALQCVAVCCSVSNIVSVHSMISLSLPDCVAVCHSVLQCVAVCCSVFIIIPQPLSNIYICVCVCACQKKHTYMKSVCVRVFVRGGVTHTSFQQTQLQNKSRKPREC